MTLDASILPVVIGSAARAATMLVEESRRPAGPRGAGDKAAIDAEIEQYLAGRLTALLPARFVGEETPIRPGDGSALCWLVDPHDGTRAWLEGFRGSAVSVALLRDGVPVLGVVCAPMSPDRGRDLIAWAEGLPHILRNGKEVKVDLISGDTESDDDRLPQPSRGDDPGRIGCQPLHPPASSACPASLIGWHASRQATAWPPSP